MRKTASPQHNVHAATPNVNMPLTTTSTQPVKQYAKDVNAPRLGRLDAINQGTPMFQCNVRRVQVIERSDRDTFWT